ncbi:MAG: hypothetical protein ACO1N0_10810 [Fluviicola sp.]
MNYALTPDGVAQMLADFYALPPLKLEEKAAAVKTDFKRFVADNFMLSNDQKAYLLGLNSRVTQYFGDQCWFCFLYKLNITLVYPDPPTPAYSKYVEGKGKTTVRAGLAGEPEATGEMIFTIIYKPA